MALVLGPQHAGFVRLARDTATRRLFVTSHRLGAATGPVVVVPAIEAVRRRGINVDVYYGTPTGHKSGTDAARMTVLAAQDGVVIRPVREPRLHAKILAWDDDFLLVTSQNWLSADPGDASLRREIGIFVNARGAARTTIERFEAIRK